MGKIFETKITSFNGGISEDKRVQVANKFSLTKHFDALTYPHKLVPYTKTQATDLEDKTKNIRKFVYGNGKFYGLGDPSVGDATRVQVYENGGLGSSDTWGASSNGTGTSGSKSTDVFFFFNNYIYALVGSGQGAQKLNRFDTNGGAFVDDLVTSLLGSGAISYTYSRQCEPVLHPSDNIMYFFTDNIVNKLDASNSLSLATLTLPTTQRIVASCAWENYLAIGCITTDTYNTRSIVYLWDRDSSLATLSERVDFGEGTLKHLFSLDNKLIGVVDFYTNPPSSIGDLKAGRIYIKQANGQTATILNYLTVDAISIASSITNTRFVRDNIAYFPMSAKLNTDNRMGIWALNGLGNLSLAIIEEDLVANQAIQAIYATANIWWIAHSGDGSVQRSSYGNAQYSQTNPAIYESLVLNNNDSNQTKKPLGVSLMFEPITVAAASVTLKYRKNEETSWTTIFTDSTQNDISHDAVNIEATGAQLPQYNEIQFQINSIGVIITGFRFQSEIIDSGKY